MKAILAIPLCESFSNDSLGWSFLDDGQYSVKTTYMLGKSCNLDAFHKSWVQVWFEIEITSKVPHFLWRVWSLSLHVKALLKHRHIVEEDLFPLFLAESETFTYALFLITMVDDAWSLGGFSKFIPQTEIPFLLGNSRIME